MGREIRRVPPNWKHPTRECTHYPRCSYGPEGACYQPMFDEAYDDAAKEWLDGLKKFKPRKEAKYYWDWNGNPPDKDYYRPKWEKGEATWFQVYQTVSEGSPVSPPFETQEELVQYLIKNGDFWDQRRGHGPWPEESARSFVFGDGWRPSMIMEGGTIKTPKQM